MLSNVELAMIDVLSDRRKPLTLNEIVEEIRQRDPNILSGKTPVNSLYSIIYRREKRRVESNESPLFSKKIEHGVVLYFLAKKNV